MDHGPSLVAAHRPRLEGLEGLVEVTSLLSRSHTGLMMVDLGLWR
jgi:hypothetical protein